MKGEIKSCATSIAGSGFIMSKTAFKAASSCSRGSTDAPDEETAALNDAKSGKAVLKNFKAQKIWKSEAAKATTMP